MRTGIAPVTCMAVRIATPTSKLYLHTHATRPEDRVSNGDGESAHLRVSKEEIPRGYPVACIGVGFRPDQASTDNFRPQATFGSWKNLKTGRVERGGRQLTVLNGRHFNGFLDSRSRTGRADV